MPEREYLRAAWTLDWVENVQIKVQSITKGTSGVGVQRWYSLVNKIGVSQTPTCIETGRSRVEDVVVDSTLVFSRYDWVSFEYVPYGIANLIETNGLVGTEESIGHGTVLEESTCDGHVKLTIGDASIYKEEVWKYCFAVCAKIAGWDEGKFGIGGDGILNPLKSKFPCNRVVVVTSSIAIAEIDHLYERIRQFLNLLEIVRNNYHLLEERLVETVIITEESIT